MKKALMIVALALLAGGCKVYLEPMIQVVVFNDCKGSTLFLAGPRVKRVYPIPYGSFYAVRLESYFGSGSDNPLIFVEGRDAQGAPLGSASRNFFIDRYNQREEAWHVSYLQGGRGCGR